MSRTKTAARGAVSRRLMFAASAALMVPLTVAVAGVPSVSAATPATISSVVLLVGTDESERVVNWYASATSAQVVEVAPTADLVAGVFPVTATSYSGVVAANTVGGGFNGHAILTGLAPDTQYSYHVGEVGGFSPTYTFKTQAFSGAFDFLFFGDPQVGSSGDLTKDQAGWVDTLNVAVGANPNTELLVSGGDQVETANTESQWAAFLAPDQLRSVPWVATIGNHDVGGRAYEQHLWTPNTDRSRQYYSSTSTSTSGGDYWFMYKGVLFIDLNSNAYSSSGVSGVDADTAHVAYVTDIVNNHGAGAKYTVLVYHHAIYSPASHANDGDNAKRRVDFPTAFSNLGVDLVLQGHDHAYSRSYMIDSGAKDNVAEQPAATSVIQGPGGVVYVTSNSASGSKYYDLSNPVAGPYGPDPLNPDNHWANSVENQEHVRTYIKVSVSDSLLVVENIRAGTCAAPNAAVERGNVGWCGPNNGTSAALAVGSVQDRVEITPLSVMPPVEVPETSFPALLTLSGLAVALAGVVVVKRRPFGSVTGA